MDEIPNEEKYCMNAKEIDLLVDYPKSNRNVKERVGKKTDEDRLIARKFDFDYFDGDRAHGYGGYKYNPKFWGPVVKTFKNHWKLDQNSSFLDVGCGKGFTLFDLSKEVPGIKIRGIDISKYAIENSIEEIKDNLSVGNAKQLPFENNSFDVVISINTIHNLALDDCALAIKEIERVKKNNSYIIVDAYRTPEEKQRMYDWNLTAKTIMSADDWVKFFKKNNYTGEYYWFIP